MRPLLGSPSSDDVKMNGPAVARRNFSPEASDTIDAVVLAADTLVAHPLPGDARYVNFSANGDFFARFTSDANAEIEVPTADVSDGSAPALNPGTRTIPQDATHVLLIASAETIVTLEFWG